MISMINRMRERQDGFTLVELLVVIVILGILIAIAVPTFLSQQDKAKDSEIKQHLNTAYKVAKSSSVDRNGKFVVGTEFDAADLANAIESSEPQLGTVPVLTTDDGTGLEAGQIGVLSGAATNEQNLKLVGKSDSDAVITLTVTGNGAPKLAGGS